MALIFTVTAVPLVGLTTSGAAVRVSKIKLNAASVSITIGGTKQLTATVTPSNATNKAVAWTSSNTGVATVSSKGLVTAKAAGKATVTCKAKDGSGKSATCAVTVKPKTPTGVKAASASKSSIKISWTAVSGATGYEVYMATSSGGTYSKIVTTTKTAYTKTGLTKNKTYYFKVRAYKTVGNSKVYSAFSAVKSAKPSASGDTITGQSSYVFRRNEDATIMIEGTPKTKYSIQVVYPSGAVSTAEGLGSKTADSSGKVSWTWRIGGRTNPGKGTATITGGNTSFNVAFEIVVD